MTFERLQSVLLVEDEPFSRDALAAMLEDLGLRCTSVDSAERAISALSGQTDLLVTDFHLPGKDGLALLEHCRREGLHFPVIFMSARADLVDRENIALQDCCATLMMKPVNVEVLMQALRAADARSHHDDCVHRRRSPVR